MDYTKEDARHAFIFMYGMINTKKAFLNPAVEVFKELGSGLTKKQKAFIAKTQNKEVLVALYLGDWFVFGEDDTPFTEKCFKFNP